LTISASSSRQIDALLADLAGPNDVARETAIARLTLIGARAVDRLIAIADTHDNGRVRAAALRALEAIGDRRALAAALRRVADPDPSAAAAAIAVARLFLTSERSADVVDRLTEAALDETRPEPVRAAAVAALKELKPRTIAPLLKKLGSPGSGRSGGPWGSEGTERTEATAGEAAEAVREWLAREGAKAPLTAVLGILERARERETSEARGGRGAWTGVRYDAHMALARRKSRLALYDLRESLERAAAPLPANAIAALALVGDASCLEPLAAAYARARQKAWRDQLLETFHAIVKREKLTPRHALMKRIAKRFGV
jgi:HEAT repeat protein